MTVHDDLATLRYPVVPQGAREAAADRVEVEIARLKDGLRNAAEGEERLAARARSDADYEGAAIHSHAASVLRALLADQGAAHPSCDPS